MLSEGEAIPPEFSRPEVVKVLQDYYGRLKRNAVNSTSREPVPAISEADATGDIEHLYADIRASLGVPVVNLIWRHFATIPGGLAWAWGSVRPLYHDGSIAAQAADFRADLQVPTPKKLSVPTLTAAGLDTKDLTFVTMILSSYERTNSMNIIALGALLAGIDGRTGAIGVQAAPPGDEAPIEGDMPIPLALAEMPGNVRDLVQSLHRIGGTDEIVPTMYRHLAHWPGSLELIHELLAPLEADGLLTPAIAEALTASRRRAAAIAPGLATLSAKPEAKAMRHIQDTLAQFIDGPLAKMVTLVAVIRRAMPGP